MLKIQLLGIGCRKSRALRANLMSALQRVPFDAVVEEIKDVNEIIKYQIYSTPALVINGKVTYQGEVPGVAELQYLLENYEYNQVSMRKILVPTDFSKNAAGAFRFAQALARQFDASVKLLHVYHPSFDVANPYLGLPYAEFESLKAKQMKAFCNKYQTVAEEGEVLTQTKVRTELKVGFAAEEIVAQSMEADLIIMGTTGEGSLLEQVFGKVSSYVAQNAHCPVLLIPPGVKYQGFLNIVYASNHQAADEVLIKQVIDLTGALPAQMHFIHVQPEPQVGYRIAQETIKKIKPRPRTTELGVKVVGISCEDVVEGISQYAEDQKADLIVMGTIHRNTLAKLFHRSATRRMVFHAQAPLLVLHFDD